MSTRDSAEITAQATALNWPDLHDAEKWIGCMIPHLTRMRAIFLEDKVQIQVSQFPERSPVAWRRWRSIVWDVSTLNPLNNQLTLQHNHAVVSVAVERACCLAASWLRKQYVGDTVCGPWGGSGYSKVRSCWQLIDLIIWCINLVQIDTSMHQLLYIVPNLNGKYLPLGCSCFLLPLFRNWKMQYSLYPRHWSCIARRTPIINDVMCTAVS